MKVAEHNQTAFAHWLLDNKADIHQRARNGEMALHMAAKNGHVEMVKLLISRGADKNKKDFKGDTAKDRARKANHDKLLSLL